MTVRDLASRRRRLIRQPDASVVHISDAIKTGLDKQTILCLNGPNLNMLVRLSGWFRRTRPPRRT